MGCDDGNDDPLFLIIEEQQGVCESEESIRVMESINVISSIS